jgi:Kef-type K+ transport system membrane component KefB
VTVQPAATLAFLIAGGAESVRLPLAMLAVFGCAKLLAELCEQLHQPGIVGEIVAGVLIGPSVLGWIAPSPSLDMLAQLGVMFLLFRVGLEVKPGDLFRVGGTAMLTAVLGVIVPFVTGWGILRLWGEPHIESVFTGAAMVATSVGITAQVLASRGLMQARAAQVIIAAAVIDDVLGLLVLAVVSGLAKGSVNLLELIGTAAEAIAFVTLVVVLGARAVRKAAPAIGERLRTAEWQFALSMCLLFGLSLLAVFAGVAAIVGAFLAGMALSETVEPRVHYLTQGVTELLVPFFLAGIGLHLNLAALGTPSTFLLALVILAAAVVSKIVGCGLGSLSFGRLDALRVGVGMVPRGEVGLVVAQIGLTMGVVDQRIYGVVVFMAVATTVIAPPILAVLFRDAKPGAEADEVFHVG